METTVVDKAILDDFAVSISKEFFDVATSGEAAIIEKIQHVEKYLNKLVDDGLAKAEEFETEHRFAPKVYLREVHIPANVLVVGKIHKYEHLNFISKGRVSVLTKDGAEEYVAPVTIISTAGTQRLLYTHEDTVWSVIHPNETDTQDLEEIESFNIAKSYDELLLLDKKEG